MLEDILEGLRPAAYVVRLVSETCPDLRAKDPQTGERCPFRKGDIIRLAQRRVWLGCRYGSIVNRQRVREEHPEEFNPLSLWNGKGEWAGRFTVRHTPTGNLYLAYYPYSDADGQAIVDVDRWTVGGGVVEKAAIERWLRPSGFSSRQETSKGIAWRTLALSNVVTLFAEGVIDYDRFRHHQRAMVYVH